MEENICNLEVSMHGIHFMQTSKTIQNLFKEVGGLIFGQSLFLLKVFFEVTAIAILHSDKLSALGTEGIYEFNDVIIMALSKYLDLSSHKLL